MERKKTLKPAYTLKNEKLNRLVQKLLEEAGDSEDRDLLIQMVTTVLKLQDEKVDRGDLKILNSSVKELRWAFRVFRPYRHVQKVSLFGSARTESSHPVYKEAKRFGALMTEKGWMTITGGSSGIMQAGNEGAGKAFSFGMNIQLPFEQSANPVMEEDRKLINFRYFFTRKLIFVKESDAICLFPGGFGTLDEGFEALTLIQTGKMIPRPIVMVEPKGQSYWAPWLRFIKAAILNAHLIDPADMNLFEVVGSAEEARDAIVGFYKNYHSARFVEDQFVIRLKRKLIPRELAKLNQRFSDIVVKGKMELSGPLATETGEPEVDGLPRLVFYFNKRSYGRLKQMVHTINDMGD